MTAQSRRPSSTPHATNGTDKVGLLPLDASPASSRAPNGATPTKARPEATASTSRSASTLRYATFELLPDELPNMVQAAGPAGRRLFWRGEMCLLGVGEALLLPMPPAWASVASIEVVTQALSSIAPAGQGRAGKSPGAPTLVPSEPTVGAVAIGALPYDPSESGYLAVPELLVGRRGDQAWATVVAPEDSPAFEKGAVRDQVLRLRALPGTQSAPDSFTLTASMSHEEWKRLIALTVAEIGSGRLAKVVLARRVDVKANRAFPLHEALGRLAALYPSCAVFRIEDFIGASPEILLKKTGSDILSHPLAGTAARSGNRATDDASLAALLASPKHRREHQFVVDAIAARLGPLCGRLDVPAEPSVLALRNVSHLGTTIRGTLREEEPSPTALQLAALLQPTPAVGGNPTDAALAWQRTHEGFDRGWYAGPVGWVDGSGDGEWVLGLRSARLDGARAQLYAGNGIVAGSDPETELAETQLKLQALLAALVRP